MQDPALSVFDFLFLSMITGKQLKVSGPRSATPRETELYIMYQPRTRESKCLGASPQHWPSGHTSARRYLFGSTGGVVLDEEFLGGPRSKRPRFCTVWRVQSSDKDPQNPNPRKVKYLSELEPSFMFKCRCAEQDLKVLPSTVYVNPCAMLCDKCKVQIV